MFEELTIADYHQKLRAGSVSCSELVNWYLDRIERLDKGDAGLNAVVTVNPNARSEAEKLDKVRAESTTELPSLFGVPILIKDQVLTAGLRTTFGSIAFQDHVPESDATVVKQLRDAGAIILGKTTMCDFAAGWFSSSSLTGHTSNAYDATRDSGGSSAGSGCAVSANLCLVAVGEDTGGSIRIPASFNNCYGFRVTTGLIPRTGASPLVHFQDTLGPMARTVDDLARLLDVLVAYDPTDSHTAVNALRSTDITYAEGSLESTENNTRVGVLKNAFGDDSDPDCRQVNEVARKALNEMSIAGISVDRNLEIKDLAEWIGNTSVYTNVSPSDITHFLENLPNAPVKSFSEIYEQKLFHPENDLFDAIASAPENPNTDVEYFQKRLNQEEFRRVVLSLFKESEVDFLVYPTVQVLPPTHKDLADGRFTCLTFPTNTVVASQAGLPSISVPSGFSESGLPVGLDIVGRPMSEMKLLQFAHRLETLLDARVKPSRLAGDR